MFLVMAADIEKSARSGRYIRFYLLFWGVLAAIGLGYLATLALQPDAGAPPARIDTAQAPEPEQGLRLANRALAEIGNVRRSVGEMQRDLGQIKENLEQRDAGEKAVQSRLAALEDKVTTLATPVATPAPPAAPPPPVAKKEKTRKSVAEAPGTQPTGQRPTARVISVVGVPASVPGGQDTPPTPSAEPAPAATPLETGSLAPAAPITFGEPVVTPSRAPTTFFAVQIGAGPSPDALRQSWSLLLEKHGETLAALEPRVVAPRTAGAPYRLVAGPLTSKAEAERVCTQMSVGRAACFSTAYVGEPL
jgi:hypothetical protein